MRLNNVFVGVGFSSSRVLVRWLILFGAVACAIIGACANDRVTLYVSMSVMCIVYFFIYMGVIGRVFIAIYFLMFVVGQMLFALLGLEVKDGFGVISPEVVYLFDCLLLISLLFYLLPNLLIGPGRRGVFGVVTARETRLCVLLLAVLLLVVFLLFFDAGGYSGLVALDRSDLHSKPSISAVVVQYLLYFCAPLIVVVRFIQITNSYRLSKYLYVWVALVVANVVVALYYKYRTIAFLHFAAFFVPYFLLSGKYGWEALSAKRKLAVLIFLSGAFVAGLVFRVVRGYIGAEAELELNAAFFESLYNITLYSGDLAYSLIGMRVLQEYGADDGFVFVSLIRAAFFFLPSFVWSGKPEDIPRVIGGDLFPDLPGMTLPPSLVGDAYLNLRYFFFLYFFSWGIGAALIDRSRWIYMIVFKAAVVGLAVHFSRGAVSNVLLLGAILLFFSIVVVRSCDVRIIDK